LKTDFIIDKADPILMKFLLLLQTSV